MRVICGKAMHTLRLHNTAVALGTFDAMHRGHRAVIQATVGCARVSGLQAVVYLFRIPPKAILSGDVKCVNSLEKRLKILEEMGVQTAVVEDFNLEYAQTSCSEFVQSLKENLGACAVYAGFNYHFGKHGQGDAQELQRLCGENGIQCEILPCVSEQGIISSSRIRALIESGDIESAESFLGRPFSVSGKVVYGNQFGRTIGFPTANMDIPENLAIPPDGVYSSRVRLNGNTYPAITNIGGKPTVTAVGRNIETHVIGFCGDLYNQIIEVEFLRRLRGIVKFGSYEELKQQLETDKQTAVEEYAKYSVNKTNG